jgi:hypothetical protein
MRLGLDFDNTIVCYDELFHRLAAERTLVPPPPPGRAWSKSRVRDHLRAAGQEEEWTRLQGQAYGPRIREAKPFPGVLDFISLCRRESIPVFVISHKTKRPYLGEPHDLHAAALEWLGHHGFFNAGAGLALCDVFLEETKAGKLARIRQQKCSHFIDDLPEILGDGAFPEGVERILFAPAASDASRNRQEADSARRKTIGHPLPDPRGSSPNTIRLIHSWAQLTRLLFQEVTP